MNIFTNYKNYSTAACHIDNSLVFSHRDSWTPFTKVTSPLGSTARACRFESCCPYQGLFGALLLAIVGVLLVMADEVV